jgi:hypothetical protein
MRSTRESTLPTDARRRGGLSPLTRAVLRSKLLICARDWLGKDLLEFAHSGSRARRLVAGGRRATPGSARGPSPDGACTRRSVPSRRRSADSTGTEPRVRAPSVSMTPRSARRRRRGARSAGTAMLAVHEVEDEEIRCVERGLRLPPHAFEELNEARILHFPVQRELHEVRITPVDRRVSPSPGGCSARTSGSCPARSARPARSGRVSPRDGGSAVTAGRGCSRA